MGLSERIKLVIRWLIGQGVANNQEDIGKLLGYKNKSSFSQVVNCKVELPKDFIDRLCSLNEKLNKVWIETGIGQMVPETSIDEALIIENPNIIMIPLVSQYAYAGYLSGFSDMEYIEALPKVPMFVDHESKGNYVAFEVRGDSMEEESKDGIFAGDRLYCREIKADLWNYKLHINQWDFVIVHRSEGILIKRIIEHNIDTGDITIHSLNPEYEDKILNLKDVAQLFNVIEVSRGKRR